MDSRKPQWAPLQVCNVSIRKYILSCTPVLTNHESQWLFFATTVSPSEDLFDPCTFIDVLSACAFPRHQRTDFARKVSLRENIVGDVCEAFTALQMWHIKTDPLRRGGAVLPAVRVFIVNPNGGRGVRCISSVRCPPPGRKKYRHIPMTRRSADAGVFPIPRVSRSWTAWQALSRAEVHSSHQETGRHFGSTNPCWKTWSRTSSRSTRDVPSLTSMSCAVTDRCARDAWW